MGNFLKKGLGPGIEKATGVDLNDSHVFTQQNEFLNGASGGLKNKVDDVADYNQGARDKENAAQAKKDIDAKKLEDQQSVLNATGTSELDLAKKAWDSQKTAGERDEKGNYKGLDEGQYAGLDRAARIEKALAADFTARSGISGGSLEYGMNKDIAENYKISEDNMLRDAKKTIFAEGEIHYQNAVTALGMSNASLTEVYKIHAAEAADASAAQQSLLSTVATLVATYYGGVAGGAIASQAFKGKGSSVGGTGNTYA